MKAASHHLREALSDLGHAIESDDAGPLRASLRHVGLELEAANAVVGSDRVIRDLVEAALSKAAPVLPIARALELVRNLLSCDLTDRDQVEDVAREMFWHRVQHHGLELSGVLIDECCSEMARAWAADRRRARKGAA